MEEVHKQYFQKAQEPQYKDNGREEPFKLYSPKVQKQLLKDCRETQQQQEGHTQKASKTDSNSKQHHQQGSKEDKGNEFAPVCLERLVARVLFHFLLDDVQQYKEKVRVEQPSRWEMRVVACWGRVASLP